MNATTKGLLVLANLFLVACAGTATLPQIERNSGNPIRSVAVLPMVNNTNDSEAPDFVRKHLAQELARHHYVIKALNEVDQILKDQLGITTGGQLDMTTSQKLCEAQGVNGILYGSLDEFNHKITGFYNAKRVRMRAMLVSCLTGHTVWKNGVGVKSILATGIWSELSTEEDVKDTGEDMLPLFGESVPAPWVELPRRVKSSNVDPLLGALASLGDRAVSKAQGASLEAETVAAVNILLNGFYKPGRGSRYQPIKAGIGPIPAGPGSDIDIQDKRALENNQ